MNYNIQNAIREKEFSNFIPSKVSTLEKSILDELSDGQWHPEYKIKKQLGENKVFDTLKKLEDEKILLSGENNSFRMNSAVLPKWRTYTDFSEKETARYTPRYFGGILEDDGWAMAELKDYDLIHFRVNGDISKYDIERLINHEGVVTRSEGGLYRVFIKSDGPRIYDTIKNAEFDTETKGFSGVRLERNVKRRELKDLPKRYTAELCQYYGNFAKVLLKSNMTSVNKHITEYDDIQQQIYLWIIDAVQKYDHTTSIPFAAYLSKMLERWVFNLNRESFGRSVADTELKHSRVITKFRNENDREPTIEEIAKELNEDVVKVKSERASIQSVANIRTMGTIDSDESIVHIAAVEDTTRRMEEYTNQFLISKAITFAAGHTEKKNVLGWLSTYHSTWGNPKNKKMLPQSNNEEMNAAQDQILQIAKKLLKESGAY